MDGQGSSEISFRRIKNAAAAVHQAIAVAHKIGHISLKTEDKLIKLSSSFSVTSITWLNIIAS